MNTLFKLKLCLLGILCSLSSSLWALTDNSFYYFFHSSGMALSAVDGTPNLHTFDATEAQTFQVVRSGTYYLLKNKKTGTYLAKKDTWNTQYSSSLNNASKFSVESVGGDYVKLKCLDNSLYVGTDGTAAGSSVYSDKNGTESLHFWFFREANATSIVTDGLENVIEKAQNKLSSTHEGVEEGDYPVAARQQLSESIRLATDVLHNVASQQDVITATQTLLSEISSYEKQRIPAFMVGNTYYIMHASNRFLTCEGNSVLLRDRDFSEKQQFVFEKNDDGTYALKNISTGKYIQASGDYSLALSNTASDNTARFKIDYAPNEELYVRFQFVSNQKYLGTDGTSDGKGVYSDKDGSDGKHYWHLIRVDKDQKQPHHSFMIGSSALRLGMNWYDEDGNHINAHGGCVVYENGTYYWFGENYRPSPVKSNGIVCYTSQDLYNWKLKGMAYKCPEVALRSDYQDMNYGRTLERPKVMYCPNTGKYVMWMHWENGSGYAASRVAILYSDKIEGPYTFLKTMRPRGDEQPSGSRDQTLMLDTDYNVGYHYGSAEENMTMHGTLLTDDFLDLSDTWERIFIKKQYEAPAIFKYHQRFVAITSGCTGWDPNPAHSSFSQLPLSGWNDLGNPCVDNNNNKSYNSQSNFVFKMPDRYDAYIFMGDRWKGGDYFSDANVGESWHIWLPIDMRTGYPIIHFYAEWDLSIFDKINRYRRVGEVVNGNYYLLLSKNANKIVSQKEGKMILDQDDDETNLSFRVSKTAAGSYMLVTESGQALSYIDETLQMQDSTGSDDQLWSVRSSQTNDGYFYLVPKTNEQKALTNFSASPIATGRVGVADWQEGSSCQFAFCFDSQKYQYAPISNESDGSYQQWIEAKGYRATSFSKDFFNNKNTDQEICLLVYNEEKGILLHSLKSQTVVIYDLEGRLIQTIYLQENELRTVSLPSGVYSINGQAIIVKE